MNIQYYENFIPYTIEELDESIINLEKEIEEVLFEKKKNKDSTKAIISISRKGGKFQIKSKYFKKLNKLLRLLGLKKKKLKQQGKDTSSVEKKIDNIKKKLR
jgi:uncharacterized small protein (DUF1192 family)